MKFNLAETLGYGKIVSKMDTVEIVPIHWTKLKTNDRNFFTVEDVQDLKDSIEVNGVLQPLLVVPDGEEYKIIAGHRRCQAVKELVGEGKKFAELPCIVLPEMSDAMEMLVLMQTNTTARELSYAEKQEAAIRLKKTLVQLKDEGVKMPGRLRDIVAEQMEISRTELARMEVIEKNLIPEAKEELKQGKMSPSAAYALARTEPECQKEILDMKLPSVVPAVVEDYAAKRKLDWIRPDCPHPTGWYENNEKQLGHNVECPNWKKIKTHKDKGHPERCPGCCDQCSYMTTCPDACDRCREALARSNRQAAAERSAAESVEKQKREKEHFLTTPFANIKAAVLPLIKEEGVSLEAIAQWWTDNLQELLPEEDIEDFDPGHVSAMIYAERLVDVDWPIAAFLAFCQAVDQTPDTLLGLSDGSGWVRYSDKKPRLNQRVIVRRTSDGVVHCGEYIYRDGRWFHPQLDDHEMNITGITHWIAAPEEG